MTPPKSVSVNGREYDAITGLPLSASEQKSPVTPIAASPVKPAVKPPKTSHSSMNADIVHGKALQHSQTLYRRGTKKPEAPVRPTVKRHSPGKHMDIARSTRVAHFAPHPTITQKVASKPSSVTKAVTAPIPKKATPSEDARPQVHPLAQRALSRTRPLSMKKLSKHSSQQSSPKSSSTKSSTSSREVKESAIAAAMAKPTSKTTKQHKKPISALRRYSIIGGIILVVLLATVYLAWRFVPTFSVSIAARQAGIEASYPEFTPDGYSLHQPVTFSEGEVTLTFASNSNDNYYSIIQTRSSWDSSAVLDNVVVPHAKDNYVTTKERGLTIYTYDNNAVWVNGGILYQIISNAPLSGEQIRRIATSL